MKNILEIVLLIIVSAFLTYAVCGCSVQTQKDITYLDGKVVHHAEAFSGRFCWMSSGIEIYDKTPYWELGSKIELSKTDPNSIESSGTAAGNAIGAAVKGAVK